ATKYRHLFDEALGLSNEEIAVLTVLMLRGAQTPGELRARTERLHRFAGHDELVETIDRLIGRDLAVRLERRPGQKEERYVHQLGDAEEAPEPASPLEERVSKLEAEVADLRDVVHRMSAVHNA